MNKIKLGIVGHGFVGKAVDEGFRINVEKFVVDPIYKTSIKELVKFNPDFILYVFPPYVEKWRSRYINFARGFLRIK